MLRPARCFSISPQMCGLVPDPPEAKVYLPGLAFTSATSSGTALVLDHELLAAELAQLLADDARQHVSRAAGGKQVDVADRLVWPVVGGTRHARCQIGGGQRATHDGEHPPSGQKYPHHSQRL